MTTPYPDESGSQRLAAPAGSSSGPDASAGQLLSRVTDDISTLLRQEVALAKAELKQEAGKAGKAGGLLGGAGFAGYMLALFASVALMAALDEAMPLWLAAAIVAALYAVVAAVLYARGRRELAQVDPVPHQTVETLKEGVPR